MYFPKYWTKTAVKGPNREGAIWETEAWGWSDISEDDARQKAQARAQETLARLPLDYRGGGQQTAYYEASPCREVILEELSPGKVRVVITRNSLGCEVLNTDAVGFADIDCPMPRISFWDSLRGRANKIRTEAKAAWEMQTLESLRNWQRDHPTLSFRVYRSAGGVRLLATSKLLQPDASETVEWFKGVGADALYRTLCLNQKSFRTRLTPKPWRCKLPTPPSRSRWDLPAKASAMEKWLEKYRSTAANYATCEFLETIGSPQVAPECQPIVDLHDERTSVNSRLPLA